jgi:CelD/BcsL family acetyltransferase involved in cellulose biosynthesis
VLEVFLENSFNFLSQEYLALFRGSCATAFQHPLWLNRLYRYLGRELNAEPMVITAREDGALKMVLPLFRRRHGPLKTIEFADLQVSDYASVVCDEKTYKTIAADPELSRGVREALKPYDILWIPKMPQGALPIGEILHLRSPVPMKMSAHAIPLGSSYEEWRADSMKPSYRKELDKKERQLNRRGAVKFECAAGAEQIEAAFVRMKEYRQLRFDPETELLRRPHYFDFYLNVAIDGASAEFARTYTLSLDGRPIACVFGIAHDKKFLILLGGFDLAQFKSLSIGALMFQQIARDCIERGDEVLDFTVGDESYKSLFGAMPSAMWSIAHARTPLGMAANFVARHLPFVAQAAKSAMRSQLEKSRYPKRRSAQDAIRST